MDIEKFNKEASEIFDNEVKPQINNAMKQTAVEWLDEQMKKHLSAQMGVDIIKQAKEMNIEEIKQAYKDGKKDAYRQDDVPTDDEYVYQKYGL